MVSWSLICWTYLRFRSAIRENRMQRRIPQKARSPLQPFLALYGLTFSSILRTDSEFQASANDQLCFRDSRFSRGGMYFGLGRAILGVTPLPHGLRSC